MSTETAENRSEATSGRLPADQVDHDALYGALTRLLAPARALLKHVEGGSAEMHRDLPPLRKAIEAADLLLDPAPLPDAPDDARVLFAHAVKLGTEVWVSAYADHDGGWGIVHTVESVGGRINIDVTLPGNVDARITSVAGGVVAVRGKDDL